MNIRVFFIFSNLIISTSIYATDCGTFANALQSTNNTITSMGEFTLNANAFCSEYSKSKGNSNSQGANLGYAALSVGYSGSSATQESTYQRSCNSGNYIGDKKSDLQNYVRYFDPKAYSVLESCLSLQNQKITFDFSENSMTPTELIIGVHSNIQMNATPKLAWNPSSDVNCQATSEFKANNNVVPFKNSVVLHCHRNNYNKESFVALSILNGSTTTFTLRWNKYNNEGLPVNVIKSFESKISSLQNEINAISKSSIQAFDSKVCPSGWEEVINARGRFLRGIDSTGSTLIDPDGLRAAGNIQEDDVKEHSHNYSSTWQAGGRSNSGTGYDSSNKNNLKTYQTNLGQYLNNNLLGKETRPKNMAVLFCKKLS